MFKGLCGRSIRVRGRSMRFNEVLEAFQRGFQTHSRDSRVLHELKGCSGALRVFQRVSFDSRSVIGVFKVVEERFRGL